MGDEMTALRERQDSLEGRVTRLEVITEREAELRATMDNDLSDVAQTLKAHSRSLQALHDTQQDHTRVLADHTRRLTTLEEKVDSVQIGVHAILDLLDQHLVRKPRRLPALRPRGVADGGERRLPCLTPGTPGVSKRVGMQMPARVY